MSKAVNKSSLKLLLLVSFTEGVAVLAVELCGAKILNAYYGSCFIVWTIVLGITLLGLALGYYFGGLAARKKNSEEILFKRITVGAVLLAFVPFLGQKVLGVIGESHFYFGLVLSAIVLIVPSLVFIGSTTSLLIQLLAIDPQAAGNSAGRVYGFSTLGGIAASIVFGFYLIPDWGISYTCVLAAIVFFLSGIYFSAMRSKRVWLLSASVLLMVAFFGSKSLVAHKKSKFFSIPYESESMMGQLKVLDFKPAGQPFSVRRLLINGIPQTFIINQPTAYSYWRYPHFIAAFSTMKDTSAKALLIGLGGGSVARELRNLHFKFDVVELDPRIITVAKKYFYLNTDSLNITIDDSRHFLRLNKKKYDLVVFDVLSGEVQPNYVFTMESLQELKQSINPDALVIINYQGILNDPADKAFSALFNTFVKSGYDTYYWATDPNVFEDIIFVLSPDKIDLSKIKREKLSECCRMLPQMKDFLLNPGRHDNAGSKDAGVLTDDKPILEQLNARAMINWRKVMLHDITSPEMKDGISIYN